MNTAMFNCYKVFRNDQLYAIMHTENDAEMLILALASSGWLSEFRIEPAFIENIGF